MRLSKVVLLIATAVVALAHRSDGQQARPLEDQLRLAGVMPTGALVYVQARDLSQLLKTWTGSVVREQFYKSPSFAEFSRSNIYLKFQDRRKDFENALGFKLNEGRLAELAGGQSAVAIYDIGKLELVFVTDVARERAIATVLFKQVPQFQERSAEGTAYYAREVATDGGRLNQQFCFAYSSGKLIVTTSEGLMIRAIAAARAAGSDSLLSDVLGTARRARGFSAHDVVMWLDQTRLNASRHFNNYWIHHNVSGDGRSSLANIESGIVDLKIAAEGLSEQRWFVAKEGGAGSGAVTSEQATALLRFAPADAQLVQVRAHVEGDGELAATVGRSLLGKLSEGAPPSSDIPDRTRSTESQEEGRARVERYSRLDSRFDRDVDDDQASAPGSSNQAAPTGKEKIAEPGPGFEKNIAAILTTISPGGYCEIARSKKEAGQPFVRFERAVVIEVKPDAALDRAGLERVLTDEVRARYVVAGVEPRLNWQDESGVRYLSQSLLEQGAAYAVSGRHLVVASSREFALDVVKAAAAVAAATTARLDAPVSFYAVVRVKDAKPVYDNLMTRLDGRVEGKSADSEGAGDVKFFSENLSSFITASAVRELRISRESDGSVTIERLQYSW